MSEMTVDMVIAALKSEPETYDWENVITWTDRASYEDLQKLAKDLTDYIVARKPRWRRWSYERDFWVDIEGGISILLTPGWQATCSEEFIPCTGWALSPLDVRFVVERLLEFGT